MEPRRDRRSRIAAIILEATVAALALLLPSHGAFAQRPEDSLAASTVYVPARCTGTPAHGCPLVVFLQVPTNLARSTRAARAMIEWQQALADKYGMILLVHHATVLPAAGHDTLLQRTLRTYAVDPEKVALVGYRMPLMVDVPSGLGQDQVEERCADPKVFSRIALLSPAVLNGGSPACMTKDEGSSPRAARVYLDAGLGEPRFVPWAMGQAPKLRRAGYPLTLALALRGYAVGPDAFERLWHWLSESWVAPTPTPAAAATTPPTRVGHSPVDDDQDSGPLLTARAVNQLTTFWNHFLREPDSIRTAARLAYQRQITVPVSAEHFALAAWAERFSLLMMDTPALATRYPSVRAALKTAGLTARQADAYRRALIIAAANRPLDRASFMGGVPPYMSGPAAVTGTSRIDNNIRFLQTHKKELRALGATGMWITP